MPRREEYTPPPPAPQPNYVSENQLPLHLRRGAQFQRNAPRQPLTPQQQMPENMQKRYAEIEQYYQANPQPTEPAPKHRRINLTALVPAVCIGLSILGVIGGIMNFVYLRGNTNIATSISFLHAELAVMFLANIMICISIAMRK